MSLTYGHVKWQSFVLLVFTFWVLLLEGWLNEYID